ncbi:ABC transporter permease [Sphingobacterium sp. Mn56C]|uniref:ABC transporter permease n=1 Tax=Sphingobacterium sp. Mn56C TaxID=3395261 RepID=UPI003BBBFFAF
MELKDFDFSKERSLSEFVQDYINLLKIIITHFMGTLLQMLVFPIGVMLLLGYFVSTKLNLNIDYTAQDFNALMLVLLCAGGALMLVALLAFGFATEYFVLLRNSKSLNFTHRDVWQSFKRHSRQYLRFLLASIGVCILICIPVGIALFISLFIPLIGFVLSGVSVALLELWFFMAFMLYREEEYRIGGSFKAAFNMVKNKMVDYGMAAFLVSFIFRILMSLIFILPSLILWILSLNFLGMTEQFYETFSGHLVITFLSLMGTLFVIFSYILSVICYGIIYEAAKELRFGDTIFDRIHAIGRRSSDV